MDVFEAICYVVAAACFFASIVRHKFAPSTLDLVALGLFLWVLPQVVTSLFT